MLTSKVSWATISEGSAGLTRLLLSSLVFLASIKHCSPNSLIAFFGSGTSIDVAGVEVLGFGNPIAPGGVPVFILRSLAAVVVGELL